MTISAERRDVLLDQLRYLLVEVDALGPLLERIPQAVLTARPFAVEPPVGDRSVLETFAYLAALDREEHAPRLPDVVPDRAPGGGQGGGGGGVRRLPRPTSGP